MYFNNNLKLVLGGQMKKVLVSVLGVGALLATLCVTGCGTEPKGAEGKVILSDSTLTGTQKAITVTLKDADLTDTVATVKVTSGSYAAGITLKLKGKAGEYSGKLYFSTTAYDDTTIRIIDGDLVTVTYKDAKPAADRTVKLTWLGAKGTIALDQGSYQSIAMPMIITVTDLDKTAPTVDVKITTTSYTSPVYKTLKATGNFGEYSGKVYFTINPPDSQIRVKHQDVVTVSYIDDVPVGTVATTTTTWTGIVGSAQPNASIGMGLKQPMTINANDADVTDATLTVHVWSQLGDPAGIDLVLPMLADQQGSFSGQFRYSTIASVPGTTLKVNKMGDTLYVSYHDAAPEGTVKQWFTWIGTSATVAADSFVYHGTSSKMKISVTEDDIEDDSIVVNVKSKKGDTTGINVTLKLDPQKAFNYIGEVGFTMGGSDSTAGAIAVKDSDEVTISFMDLNPAETQTTSVTWYSNLKPALGIFGQNMTPGSSVIPGLLPKFFIWTNTCTADSTVPGMNGGYGIEVTGIGGWAGFGWANVATITDLTATGINMTAYAACTLHVAIKGDANAADLNLLVENNNPGGNTIPQTWVPASTYGYAPDGEWHELAIPLSAWSATCDFTNLTYFFGVSMNPYVVGEKVTISDLYWTLPQ
jgi:hypothetical protein